MNIFDQINGNYAHGLSFGWYRVWKISTGICVSRKRFGETIFGWKNKTKQKKNSHTVSPEYAGLHQTKLWRVTFECSRLLFPSFVYDKIEGKLSNRLTAATLKDFRLENVVCSKYQLIFVSAEEVLSKPFLSWLKKKLPYRFTHRLYMRLFLSGDFNCSRELSWINRKG